jgi:hypothetical protein
MTTRTFDAPMSTPAMNGEAGMGGVYPGVWIVVLAGCFHPT